MMTDMMVCTMSDNQSIPSKKPHIHNHNCHPAGPDRRTAQSNHAYSTGTQHLPDHLVVQYASYHTTVLHRLPVLNITLSIIGFLYRI